MTTSGADPLSPPHTRSISLIVNPSAGGGRAGRLLGEVEVALSARGLSHHVEPTHSLEHAAELAAAAAAAGEVAAAFGGDGLIAAVAGALRDADGVLALLPGGRGNDLARVLGIPPDPVAACDVLASGVVRRLDLGQVGERPFMGIASCGFDSEANRIANQTRLLKGNLVYAYGAIRALASWHPACFELTFADGRRHVVTGYSVGAANSKAYGGGMYAAPDAELDDGLLDVVTCADMPKWRFLTSLLPKVFKGAHIEEPEVTVLRAPEVRIAADRPFTMYADGDPIAELPATVRVLPRAVQVLVPR
jgi:YegS/Rv2252/BmrU family lipid kinase